MYEDIFRKWAYFLKKRKLYPKFVLHCQTANSRIESYGMKTRPFKMINGHDYVNINKHNNFIDFQNFLYILDHLNFYSSSVREYTFDWKKIGIKFGEINGYIPRQLTLNPIVRSKRENNSKWYDKFYRTVNKAWNRR